MADSIGIALTGLGGTLRDLASQEALYRQQERTGQLALAEVGLKSQLLQQQGQQEIAKQGVSLEQARSQTALGQFEAGLKSAQEGRAEQKFPLEQQSLQTGIDFSKFQLERGKTLLPGEQGLQQANITHLGSQTGLTQAQTTELTDPNSPSNIVKRQHAELLKQQGLGAAQDVAQKTYDNTQLPVLTVIKDYLAPAAAANPIGAQLWIDAIKDYSDKAGINLETEMIRRGDADKYTERLKALYPILEKQRVSVKADSWVKEYHRTGDRGYLELAQQELTRSYLKADPEMAKKLVDESIKSGQAIPDLQYQSFYGLRPTSAYTQILMSKKENATAYAKKSKEEQATFLKALDGQAATLQAQDAMRIDQGLAPRSDLELLGGGGTPTPAAGQPAGAPPTAPSQPSTPSVARPTPEPPPAYNRTEGPSASTPVPQAPLNRIAGDAWHAMTAPPAPTPGPEREGPSPSSTVSTAEAPLNRLYNYATGGTTQAPAAQAPVETSPGIYSRPGLAQAAAPSASQTQPSPSVPPTVEAVVKAYDEGGKLPGGRMPDGKYNVALANRRLYLVEVQQGAITFIHRAR